jgi:hypothetical protein
VVVRPKTGKKRLDFYLTETQVEKMKALSEKTGLSVSEHMRRAIDEYLDRQKKK